MKTKNLSKKIDGIIARVTLAATKSNVNTTCEYWAYQPKLPKNAKKLRKF